MNIHNRQSNKQVFFSLEFVNILLQVEATPVKMCDSSLLKFSAHSELKTGLLVEWCTSIVEVKGSNPIQARIFSGFLFTTAKVASFTAMIYFYLLYRHKCFTGKYATRKIHKNYIRDPSGLFSIILHVSLSMT